jgi:hypothetical protein
MTQENRSDYSATKSSREMENAIGETRAALSDDIKALGDKASPSHVKQEIKQALKTGKDAVVDKTLDTAADVKDAALEAKNVIVDKAIEVRDVATETAHKAADAVAETVEEVSYQTRRASSTVWTFTRANALPLTLLGIGASWLFSNQRKSSEQRAYLPPPAAWRPTAEYDEDLAFDDDTLYGVQSAYPMAGSVPEPTYRESRARRAIRRGDDNSVEPQRTKGQSARALRAAGVNIQRSGRAAYEKTEDALEQAEHVVGDTVSRGRDFVREKLALARNVSLDFADENPMTLAFGTLVAGIGIGLLLPSGAREAQLLAPSRDRVKRAIGSAREAAQDVGRVAKRTVHEARATIEGNR